MSHHFIEYAFVFKNISKRINKATSLIKNFYLRKSWKLYSALQNRKTIWEKTANSFPFSISFPKLPLYPTYICLSCPSGKRYNWTAGGLCKKTLREIKDCSRWQRHKYTTIVYTVEINTTVINIDYKTNFRKIKQFWKISIPQK